MNPPFSPHASAASCSGRWSCGAVDDPTPLRSGSVDSVHSHLRWTEPNQLTRKNERIPVVPKAHRPAWANLEGERVGWSASISTGNQDASPLLRNSGTVTATATGASAVFRCADGRSTPPIPPITTHHHTRCKLPGFIGHWRHQGCAEPGPIAERQIPPLFFNLSRLTCCVVVCYLLQRRTLRGRGHFSGADERATGRLRQPGKAQLRGRGNSRHGWAGLVLAVTKLQNSAKIVARAK